MNATTAPQAPHPLANVLTVSAPAILIGPRFRRRLRRRLAVALGSPRPLRPSTSCKACFFLCGVP